MSSSVIDSPAVAPIPVRAEGAPVTSGAGSAAAPPANGITRVELLLAAATEADADTVLRRVGAACAIGVPSRWSDREFLRDVPADAAAAVSDFGGRLRRVAVIECRDGVGHAWRGVAVIPERHLFAGIPDGHPALVIHPTSGPAVLLAMPLPWPEDVLTLLTRVARAASSTAPAPSGTGRCPPPAPPAWVMALAFPHAVPPGPFVAQLLAAAGVPVRRLVLPPGMGPAGRCWAELHPAPRAAVARARAALHRVHRVVGQSWVVL
jgi:hypothetical protein